MHFITLSPTRTHNPETWICNFWQLKILYKLGLKFQSWYQCLTWDNETVLNACIQSIYFCQLSFLSFSTLSCHFLLCQSTQKLQSVIPVYTKDSVRLLIELWDQNYDHTEIIKPLEFQTTSECKQITVALFITVPFGCLYKFPVQQTDKCHLLSQFNHSVTKHSQKLNFELIYNFHFNCKWERMWPLTTHKRGKIGLETTLLNDKLKQITVGIFFL